MKQREELRYLSPNQKAFIRFKKNKPAVAGFWVIVLAILIAIFGYFIAPDPTTFANEQVLEIATKSPGFQIELLKVRKNKKIRSNNFFSRLLNGIENPYQHYPIIGYQIEGDSLKANIYTGIEGKTDNKDFHLVDVAFGFDSNFGINTFTGEYEFKDIKYGNSNISRPNLIAQIEQENLETALFRLGTDKFGRDNLSRLILGVRVSITVGLLAAFISLIIGVLLGSIAGFYRKHPPRVSYFLFPAIIVAAIFLYFGFSFNSTFIRVSALALFFPLIYYVYRLLTKMLRNFFSKNFALPVDDVIMWFINVFWSIPLLLLVFAMVLALGREFWQIYVAVGLTMWVEIARIVRGQFLTFREKEFVEAGESLGFTDSRIILKHILPNCIGPIIVLTAANFATAIIIEAGLSFLGIGVMPPRPSWGIMLNEYYQYIGSSKSFLAIIPGTAIMLLVLAFNLMGNGLRDAFDVKTKL